MNAPEDDDYIKDMAEGDGIEYGLLILIRSAASLS